MQYFSEDYLEHHGIPGQKWGVRRYQNTDGSLTPRGKKRVAKLEKKVDKIYAKKTKGTQEKIDAAKAARDRSVYSNVTYKGRRHKVPASKADSRIMNKGNKALAKQAYQQKLRDIRKSEIRNGFNYYEREDARNWTVGYLIGGIPGGTVGKSIAANKYKEGINARHDLRKDYKNDYVRDNKSRSYNQYINRK